jgi:hypothetical protein
MNTRAERYARMAKMAENNKSMTPFEKANAWVEMAREAEYDVNPPSPEKTSRNNIEIRNMNRATTRSSPKPSNC